MKKMTFYFSRYNVALIMLLSITLILITLSLNEVYRFYLHNPIIITFFIIIYLYIFGFSLYSFRYIWFYDEKGFRKQVTLPFIKQQELIFWEDVHKIKKIDIMGTPYLIFYYLKSGKEKKIYFPPFLNNPDDFLNLLFKKVNHIIINKDAIKYLQFRK